GIGLAVVKKLAAKGDVIATVRSVSKAAALTAISNVKLVQLEAESEESIASAASEIAKLAPTGIDLLWNNIGVYNISGSKYAIDDIKLDTLNREITINAVAPILLTTKLLPLLAKRETKKVVFVTSLLGSITAMGTALADFVRAYEIGYSYSASKTTLNALINFLNIQHKPEGFTFIPIHPGLVETDMTAQEELSLAASVPKLSPDASAEGMISVVENVTSEDKLVIRDYAGEEFPW
ncbi:uncharacterized protein V1518DRAFT_449702, partial [Limtongia smithiae]|uniref:uncharacterized protein n=1 Tax=Limtongia smithiae TaxID=1125753 RepID=UPI0034CE07C0